MTEKVTIERRDQLPMPLIYLASAQDLANWQLSQLEWAYAQGHRCLAISCFNTAAMGLDLAQAAYLVLKTVMDFLYDHPDIHQLQILCGDEASLQAYSFHWNMWYAAHKPEHSQGDLEN